MNRFTSTIDIESLTASQCKAWEGRMRRALATQGLVLNKSRRRTAEAMDYGLYNVSNNDNVSLSGGYTLSARTVEEWARS